MRNAGRLFGPEERRAFQGPQSSPVPCLPEAVNNTGKAGQLQREEGRGVGQTDPRWRTALQAPAEWKPGCKRSDFKEHASQSRPFELANWKQLIRSMLCRSTPLTFPLGTEQSKKETLRMFVSSLLIDASAPEKLT